MRRLRMTALTAGLLLSAASSPSGADTVAGVVEGCTAASPGTTVPNPADGTPGTSGPLVREASCGYHATTNGGWCALAERWEIVLYSGGGQVLSRQVGGVTTLPNGDSECASHLAMPGTYVEAHVTNGVVRIGNDVPVYHPAYDPVWEAVACLIPGRCN